MSLDAILDPDVNVWTIPDTPEGVWKSRFPGRELVDAAAGLFVREQNPATYVGDVAAGGRSYARSVELGYIGARERNANAVRFAEGPQWRVEVGPGLLAVRSSDPARSERGAERAVAAHAAQVRQLALAVERGDELPEPRASSVRVWSRKSRARMVQRLNELDFSAMLDGRPPVMLTLTYPGEWLSVAPDSATCHGHLLKLRKRFERAWGRPLVAVWKREFQRRGAPHYHLLMQEPAGEVNGEDFRTWVSRVWSEVVGHADPEQRRRHQLAGTGVDRQEGAKCVNPVAVGAYFSKHGTFSAKDYQNEPPAEWGDGSVGRFWGYWHLEVAVSAVEVAPDVARAVARTARRWHAAQGRRATVTKWRKVTTVDRESGELGWKWRRRRTTVPVRRLARGAGFVAVKDGPALASELARYAAQVQGRAPVGRFLP